MFLRPITIASVFLTLLGAWVRAEEVSCDTTTWRTATGSPLPKEEVLEFALRWGVVTAGHATLAVDGVEQLAGRPAYHVSSYARSTGAVNTFYKVQDHSDSWLDTASL